ncbi:MAG: hypothetical protein WDO68_17425 [Gammaproteobacteria bacterium]
MSTPATPSLFDPPSGGTSLTEALARSKPANKAQQRFRKLVTQIEQQRERLKQWEDYPPRYNQRVSGELAPLQKKLRDARKQMALLIDELLSMPTRDRRLGKVQRLKLQQLITQLVEDLLQESDDEALKALRDKYQEPVDEEDQLLRMEVTREILQGMTGLEIDDDHAARSPEELFEYVRRTMQERSDDAGQAEPRRGHDREEHLNAQTAEARAERERATRQVSQSLRDVFRKLVSALHPDREPDAAERQRKNELMQRVNRAYEANDLLTLLGLQLEIEQIDTAHLSSLSPQRLAQYTQILREQLADLGAELERAMQPFVMAMGGGGSRLTPADVDRQLSADIARMRITLRHLREDLDAFRDPDRLRRRLAEYELDASDPFDDLEELASAMRDFQRGPGSRRSGR